MSGRYCRKQTFVDSGIFSVLETRHDTAFLFFGTALQKSVVGSEFKLPNPIRTIFEDQIVVGGAMIKLRLILLIGLVLDPKKQLFHIFTVGGETGLVMSLYRHSLRFAQRSFPAMAGTPLCGKVTSDSCYSWAPYFIHAGVLPLCSGGVCLCGDVGLWKKQPREQLQAALSGGKIFLDLAPKHTGGLSQQQSLSLQCHVWGAFSPLTSAAKVTGQKDCVLVGGNTGDLNKSFLDAFSYICFLDGGNSFVEEEIYTQTCYHHLVSWCGDGEESVKRVSIQQEDMDVYVSMARQLEPHMTPAAETLIQSYYAAVRLARSSGLGGSDVPVSGISTVSSLATGFAKLRLSRKVEETDAVLAAYLYEESLVSRLGLSVLSVQPQPHITDGCISEFLCQENDFDMQKFQVQLLKFCSRAFDSRSALKEE